MSFFEIHDPVFRTYVIPNAPVKQLAGGFDWAEGPVWFRTFRMTASCAGRKKG